MIKSNWNFEVDLKSQIEILTNQISQKRFELIEDAIVDVENEIVPNDERKILDEINRVRTDVSELYHENQYQEMCGLHALNNALQYSFFTSNYLIQIAKNLQIKEEQLYYDLSNVDKNIYSNSFGNFNSKVLVTALEKKNFEVKRYNEVIDTGLYIVCNGYLQWFAIRKFYDSGPI